MCMYQLSFLVDVSEHVSYSQANGTKSTWVSKNKVDLVPLACEDKLVSTVYLHKPMVLSVNF